MILIILGTIACEEFIYNVNTISSNMDITTNIIIVTTFSYNNEEFNMISVHDERCFTIKQYKLSTNEVLDVDTLDKMFENMYNNGYKFLFYFFKL